MNDDDLDEIHKNSSKTRSRELSRIHHLVLVRIEDCKNINIAIFLAGPYRNFLILNISFYLH